MLKLKFILVLSLFSISTYLCADSGKLSLRTLELISLSKKAKVELLKKQFNLKSEESQNYANSFIVFNSNPDIQILKSLGVKINNLIKNIATAQIPISRLEAVSDLSFVKHVEVGAKVSKRMDAARIAAKVDEVHDGINLDGSYTGKGVVVGVIDNGFQYNHINFYNSEGTETRLMRVWDQNATGTPPNGYSYGAEYKTQTEIFNAKSDVDYNPHATHVAGIAVGGDKNNNNKYYGVAPDADLVFVSFSMQDMSTDMVSVTDAIKYIYDYAESVNKPCVVNMSLGTHDGPHDGSSIFDQVCDELQGDGRLLVGAAGNEGAFKIHLSKRFVNTTDTLKSFINFLDPEYVQGHTFVWGDGNKDFFVKAVVYNRTTKSMTFSTPFFKASSGEIHNYDLSIPTDGITGTISLSMQRSPINNKPNADIKVELSDISSNYSVGFIITAIDGSAVNVWTQDGICEFTDNAEPGWTDGDTNNTVGEIGGTGKRIISVGAFTTKNFYTNLENDIINSYETLSDIAFFSSKGPTADNRVKPDITAPGSVIVSSFPIGLITNDRFEPMVVSNNIVNSVDNYYAALEGTSMSAPFVSGVLALWLQAYKKLSPEQARDILKETAISDNFTGEIPENGSNTWGFGKMDAWNGIKYCISLASSIQDVNNGKILIYPNPCRDYLSIFSSYDTNVYVTIKSLSGQQITQRYLDVVDVSHENRFDVSELPQGIYLLNVKGVNFNKTYKILKI